MFGNIKKGLSPFGVNAQDNNPKDNLLKKYFYIKSASICISKTFCLFCSIFEIFKAVVKVASPYLSCLHWATVL